MIEKLRIGAGILRVALATLIVVPGQWIALKTGWYSEGLFARFWHRTIVRALGMRIHVVGEMAAQRPLLIAANHVSWTDIMVIGSLIDVCFVAKSELAGWPIMGKLSRLQRTVFVERHRKRKSGEQASEIARLMADGHAMLLFAEGTTADGNFLLPFKSTLFGAAKIAIDEGTAEHVFVQPVAIVYTRLHGIAMGRRHRAIAAWIGGTDLWPHLKRLLGEGAVDVEVHFGAPLEFAAHTSRKETAREIEARVRAMMIAALADPA